jgi:hypothetical protein
MNFVLGSRCDVQGVLGGVSRAGVAESTVDDGQA